MESGVKCMNLGVHAKPSPDALSRRSFISAFGGIAFATGSYACGIHPVKSASQAHYAYRGVDTVVVSCDLRVIPPSLQPGQALSRDGVAEIGKAAILQYLKDKKRENDFLVIDEHELKKMSQRDYLLVYIIVSVHSPEFYTELKNLAIRGLVAVTIYTQRLNWPDGVQPLVSEVEAYPFVLPTDPSIARSRLHAAVARIVGPIGASLVSSNPKP